MCGVAALLLAGSAVTSVGQLTQGISESRQKKALARQSERNAEVAELFAQDAIERGDIEVAREAVVTEQNVGAARVSAAARGVDVNLGSAIERQADVAAAGAKNAEIIRNNAEREALGFRTQGLQFRTQAQQQRFEASASLRQSVFSAGATALGGGASAFRSQQIASQRQLELGRTQRLRRQQQIGQGFGAGGTGAFGGGQAPF